MRGLSGQSRALAYLVQDQFGMKRDHLVLESENPEAASPKFEVPHSIQLRVVMRPIRFDDQLASETGEVDDVRAEGDLATELQTRETTIA
jgi:hypothetical protein